MRTKIGTCTGPDCENPVYQVVQGRRLCGSHHSQHYRKNGVLTPIKDGYGPPVPEGLFRTSIVKDRDKFRVLAFVWPGHKWFDYAPYSRKNSTCRTGHLSRLVMADKFGRRLETTEQVHHIDGDPLNNDITNLQIRHGNHGTGVKISCLDCGSSNCSVVELD